jgi:hypothetical protein
LKNQSYGGRVWQDLSRGAQEISGLRPAAAPSPVSRPAGPGKGGHFAAWEQPQLFSEEVRAGFRPLRK